jgi:DNA-binding response OmpR family regulator
MQFGEPASSLPSPEWVSELLLVDGAPETAAHAEALRRLCATVNVTAHQHTALQFLRRSNPTLVVIAGNLTDGSSIALCKEAKSKQRPPSVLVTPDRPEDVPDSLAAGCDGVLLKPFSSSLLVNRVSRLLRARAEDLRRRSARSSGKAQHLLERSGLLPTGTNCTWPSSHCPYCSHRGVTSFDYTSNRRAWYACLECKKVWLAKRQDL